MPFEIAYHIDVIRFYKQRKRERNYVVILSRHPIVNRDSLRFFDFPFPLHTRLFISFMAMFRWSFVTERGAVYADIETEEGRLLRVFSVHLTLWGPTNRRQEFEAVSGHIEPGKPVVICGDFNVIEYGPMKILNWLLGAPLREAVPWYPERDLFEERFEALSLRNPLRGKVTHRFSRSQLDHILVSRDLSVSRAWVEPESYGSDHQPVAVELGPEGESA